MKVILLFVVFLAAYFSVEAQAPFCNGTSTFLETKSSLLFYASFFVLCSNIVPCYLIDLCLGTPTGSPNYRLSSVTVDPQVVDDARYLFPEQRHPHPSITAGDVSFQLIQVRSTRSDFVQKSIF
jgi:hypothetical protein